MALFQRFKGLAGSLAALAAKRQELDQQQQSGAAEQPRFQCRLCGHQDLQGQYCPECLAQTMEPLQPGAGSGQRRDPEGHV